MQIPPAVQHGHHPRSNPCGSTATATCFAVCCLTALVILQLGVGLKREQHADERESLLTGGVRDMAPKSW